MRFFIFIILYSLSSYADNTISEYLKLHSKFIRTTCSKAEDQTYFSLYKEYVGEGLFIPVINEQILDEEAIISVLPEIKKKIEWLSIILLDLKMKKTVSVRSELKRIENNINNLLVYKKNYLKNNDQKALNSSQNELNKLRNNFEILLGKISHLLNYTFPIDHFYFRSQYELYKDGRALDYQKKKNAIFILRKVQEDGSYSLDLKRSDIYPRALLSTVALNLPNEKDILSENMRYDLESVIKNVKANTSLSKQELIYRIKAWLERTQNTYKFYANLVRTNKLNKYNAKEVQYLVSSTVSSRAKLRDYVLKQHSKVFLYWSKQKEIYKSLFVLDTILFNEVGPLDLSTGDERKDVAQVVLNRMKGESYKNLGREDYMYPHLIKLLTDEEIQKEYWLNILFKESEFSFTYYFIRSTTNVFCPDQSHNGKKLRLENLKLALNVLKNKNTNFNATRYFSRGAMLGRIDMAKIWADYRDVEERPGPEIKLNICKQFKCKYLYSFSDYDVVRANDKIYVMNPNTRPIKYFHYRDPQKFRYFYKK